MRKIQLKPHKCPVCGKYEFPYMGSFDICDECGWQDDPVQLTNPDEWGGANHESLNDYRKKYESGWRPEEDDEEGL